MEHSARGGGVAAAVASPLGVGRAHSPPGNEVRKYVPQAVEQQAIRCLRAEHRPRSDAATWGAVDLDPPSGFVFLLPFTGLISAVLIPS